MYFVIRNIMSTCLEGAADCSSARRESHPHFELLQPQQNNLEREFQPSSLFSNEAYFLLSLKDPHVQGMNSHCSTSKQRPLSYSTKYLHGVVDLLQRTHFLTLAMVRWTDAFLH